MENAKNLLIAGACQTGKTSLGVALARGVCPPPGSIPKRFEGWTVTACQKDYYTSPPPSTDPNELKRTHSNSSTGSTNSSSKSSLVHFTIWEDWPRKSKRDEEEEESEEDEEESEENKRKASDEVKKKKSSEKPKDSEELIKIKEEAAQTKHVLLASNSSASYNQMERNKEDNVQLLPRPAPCLPVRPCLSPRPDTIVLCFSALDLNSFVETEEEIWPELADRYPLVPIILVANKCDAKDKHAEELESVEDEDSCTKKFGFIVSSEMGVALAKRIGASAYIECSSRDTKSLKPILQEIVKSFENSPHTLGYSSLPSSPRTINATSKGGKNKKNSAPSFLFQTYSKKKKASMVLNRGKTASLNFIRGGTSATTTTTAANF